MTPRSSPRWGHSQTSTKLTGPGTQNVSYFVSDGDPTASSDWPATMAPARDPVLPEWHPGERTGCVGVLPYDQQNRFLRIRHSRHRYSGEPRSDRLRSGVGHAACRHADHRNRPWPSSRTLWFSPCRRSMEVSWLVPTVHPRNSFGADGGFVRSITVDGVTYTFNPTANSVITTSWRPQLHL